MKKLLSIFLLITSILYGNTYTVTPTRLNLSQIQYAPGAGYIPYTDLTGKQTYSLLSTVSSKGTVKSNTLTANYIPKALGSDSLGNSSITDNVSQVTVNNNFYVNSGGAEVAAQGNAAYISGDQQTTSNIESNLLENYFFHSIKNRFNSPLTEIYGVLNVLGQIQSPNTLNGITINDTHIVLGQDAGGAEVSLNTSENYIKHNVKNTFDAPANNFPQLTASQIVETDAGKNLISVAKGTAYNKAFGSTAGTVTEGNDSRLSNSRNEKLYLYQNTDNTITGTSATETVLFNGKVNGGDIGANGVFNLNFVPFKVGTAAGFSFKVYLCTVGTNVVGSTGTPSSSTLFAQMVYGNTVLYGGNFNRRMVNKNSQSSNVVYPVGVTNAGIDNANTATARTVLNFNTANDFWVVVTCTMNSAADTGGISDLQIQIDKP